MGERTVRTNGVDLHVVDEGPPDGPVVVLAHGFPELAYSWRHQIPALAGAGYRVLAPDQRGYGRSSRPAAVTDYDVVRGRVAARAAAPRAGAGQPTRPPRCGGCFAASPPR